jgi:tetratricopeptide (TPR) repeat protein
MLEVLWQISDNPHRMSKLKIFILLVLITATYSSRSLYAYQAPANNNEVPAKAPEARGILRQAKAAARSIKNQLQRDALMDQIGAAEASTGDLEAAIETANLMRFPPIGTLREIGAQLAAANDLNRARTLGRKLKTGGPAGILPHLSDAQARKGDIAGALKTAELIENLEIRSYALASIAELQAVNGDYAGARMTQSQARKTYPPSRLRPEGDLEQLIVISQLSRGETPAARAAIASAQSPEEKFSMLIAGADVLWKKGDHAQAIEWLEEALKALPAAQDYAFLRYFAIPYQVRLGQKDAAIRAAAALSGELRVKGYMAVAITCAETKDVACVHAAADQMKLTTQHAQGSEAFGLKLMMLNITAALIDNQQPQEADRFLRILEQQSDDASFKWGIEPRLQLQRVWMLAQQGKFVEARLLAMKFRPDSVDETDRGTALRITALLETKQNGTGQSLPWAQSLRNNQNRAYALLGVAQGLLGSVEVKLRYSVIQVH